MPRDPSAPFPGDRDRDATPPMPGPEALEAQIADSFPAGQQFATAAGFTMRIACPLAGREVPDLPQALGPRLAVARAMLGAMTPSDFDGAEARVIRHQAGFAEMEQRRCDGGRHCADRDDAAGDD